MSKEPDTPQEDPEAFGFLAIMRYLERHAGKKPRFGRSLRIREELAQLGQDPFLTFPDNDLSEVTLEGTRPRIRPYFLGFYGPHGALPLNYTEEILQWFEQEDTSFVDFTDIFATRFIQLFYRAWADARAIAQFDHPTDDRFQKYLLSLAGLGTPAFLEQSETGDTVRLRTIALMTGRVKSPIRLRQMLQLHLSADVEIEEMVPGWMEFEPDSLSRLGMQGSMLGQSIHLGNRIQSIGEKIRIHIHTNTIAAYRRFLPGGPDYMHLRMLVLSYLGVAFDVDVALWLPQPEVEATQLGSSGELGWMACIAPQVEGDEYVRGTNYRLVLTETETAEAA